MDRCDRRVERIDAGLGRKGGKGLKVPCEGGNVEERRTCLRLLLEARTSQGCPARLSYDEVVSTAAEILSLALENAAAPLMSAMSLKR